MTPLEVAQVSALACELLGLATVLVQTLARVPLPDPPVLVCPHPLDARELRGTLARRRPYCRTCGAYLDDPKEA
jgi:hypothetical protein